MPRSVRLEAKRKLDSIRTHTSTINYHLEQLWDWYKDAHPEWADRFALAAQLNAELDNLIEKFNQEL